MITTINKFKKINENNSFSFFNDAYDVDNYNWKKTENNKFISKLTDLLLELSNIEDNNTNFYITEMSQDKQNMLIKIGNILYLKDK